MERYNGSKTGTPCYLYKRVSTEIQVDGYSLEAQHKKLKRYADYEGMPIAGIYSDEGKSGKSVEGRPQFREMLEDIKSGKDNVKYVLVFKLSRFGRNAADVLSSLQLMQDYGVNLICVEDGIDSSKDSGKLMISVLSAVAEIERENILVQTMEGRKQKAREGKWNGGFAPYGYKLADGKLEIEEDEAEVIRIIFDKYIDTNMGATGVAKYLNQNGIAKKPRANGTLTKFSVGFIRGVLDNPVYCGKIAFGRRTREKIQGSRDETRQVKAEDYILVDGIHEAIVDESRWEIAKNKRDMTGGRREKKYSIGRRHLLSGILKCPICASGMVGNVNRKKRKDGTLYRDYFYYACKHRRVLDGHTCTYNKQWKEEMINDAVVEVIRKVVKNERFAEVIKGKIGGKVDTTEIEKEIENYEHQLKQANGSKRNIERQIDSLSIEDRHYERKLNDLQDRLNNMYDEIADLEELMEELKIRKKNIEMDKISVDNIYRYLLNFNQLYDEFNDDERRELLSSFIDEVLIYEDKQENGQLLKRIHFRFPVFYNGQDIDTIGWDKEGTVETVCLLSKLNVEHHIEVDVNLDEMDLTKAESKATYEEIKKYALEHIGLRISNLYIA